MTPTHSVIELTIEDRDLVVDLAILAAMSTIDRARVRCSLGFADLDTRNYWQEQLGRMLRTIEVFDLGHLDSLQRAVEACRAVLALPEKVAS